MNSQQNHFDSKTKRELTNLFNHFYKDIYKDIRDNNAVIASLTLSENDVKNAESVKELGSYKKIERFCKRKKAHLISSMATEQDSNGTRRIFSMHVIK